MSGNERKKPDSVMKHEKFQDLMRRYHGQMENALYAIEQLCPHKNPDKEMGEECYSCPNLYGDGVYCSIPIIRDAIGDHVQQHDIQIPVDNTPSERKMNR